MGKKKETMKCSTASSYWSIKSGMGGVDLMDKALSDFRPVIHGKKLYWPLVKNTLNIGFVYF